VCRLRTRQAQRIISGKRVDRTNEARRHPAPAPYRSSGRGFRGVSNPPTFTKAAWASLLAHASKDETRVNLNQIAIWSDGSAAATDGHRL
jgi:hypothetical protein